MEIVNRIFVFSRGDGSVIGQVHLRPDHTIGMYSHPNERRWDLVDGKLVFIGDRGTVTSVFERHGLRWVGNNGAHYLDAKVSGDTRPSGSSAKPHLIYMNAYGDKYQRMALALIDTLRNRGQYRGEITVFCDTAEWARSSEVTPVILDRRVFGNAHPTLYRFLLDDWIDDSKYDQILYLDDDILCLSPIEPLFCAGNDFRYATESVLAIAHPHINMTCMTHEERLRMKDVKIANTGQICFDARIFKSTTKVIREVVADKAHVFGVEQSAFTKAVYLNLVPGTLWEEGRVNFSIGYKQGYPPPILMHYCGNHGRMFYDYPLARHGFSDR